jgi:hypothetical protein
MTAEQTERKQEQTEAEDDKARQEKAVVGDDNAQQEKKHDVPHRWAAELESYPLRPAEEDAGWVIKTVKVWLWLAIASGLFILILLVLGYFFD